MAHTVSLPLPKGIPHKQLLQVKMAQVNRPFIYRAA